MGVLKRLVISETLDEVRVVYLDRGTASWWNKQRNKDDTVALCGWFWVRGDAEAGPFKTRSASLRDAYYKFVLRRDAPSVVTARPKRKKQRILVAAE